ncbi:MAG: DegT/DnrJ/EryC1/StrS aminotransferase family protein [Actinobacteria bacterium]|nr:MAG: DegT/DnrJ/EryC1/StrS aminotransferase family protein [Actinomycetota bacterium]
MADPSFIPFALPDVGDAEAEAVAATIRSGWVTSGPTMRSFEDDFVDFVGGAVEAVAVNSATAGLHLALEAIGVGPGDEVIVPTWTFTATAEVVRYLGATPVIVDVEPDTLNIDLDAVAGAVTSATRAVIPVHFAGLPVDLRALRAAVGADDIRIIEDAAHALPASGPDGLVGTAAASDAAVFSFYATKTITTGEGGMITTRDPDIAARCRVMRLHGIDRDAFDRYTSDKPSWAYDVVAPGYKYNMPDTAAAMGRVQLARAHAMQQRRQQIAERYTAEFADLPVRLPASAPPGAVHAWHLYVIRLAEGTLSRDAFIGALAERGIGTSVHFIPLHEHSYWRQFAPDAAGTLPVAVGEAPRAVSLPIYSGMTDGQVGRVCEAVREVLG